MVGFEGEVWMHVLMEVDGRNIKWEEEETLCPDDDHHDLYNVVVEIH